MDTVSASKSSLTNLPAAIELLGMVLKSWHWLPCFDQDHGMQVQRWAPAADRRLEVQLLVGFKQVNVNVQWRGPKSEAAGVIRESGLMNIPNIQV